MPVGQPTLPVRLIIVSVTGSRIFAGLSTTHKQEGDRLGSHLLIRVSGSERNCEDDLSDPEEGGSISCPYHVLPL